MCVCVRVCVCLSSVYYFLWTKYLQKLRTNLDKIVWRGEAWPRGQSITFRWWSVSGSRVPKSITILIQNFLFVQRGWCICLSRTFTYFLLLARYVPNVAKRSTWHQCIYWGPTDQRPTTDLASWKISNGHHLGNGSSDPLHLWFYVGLSGSADRMPLFSFGPNPRSRPSSALYNFEWTYLWNGSSDPIRIWF